MRVYLYIVNLTIFLLAASAAFSSEKNLQLEIRNYLQNMKSFSADFKQVNELGEERLGKIYLLKPKKIRLDYLTPKEEQIFIDADLLIHYDKALDEITYINSDGVSIDFMLDPIKQVFENKDTRFYYTDNDISFRINNSKLDLTVVFSRSPTEIKKIVTYHGDDQITLVLYNQEHNHITDESLFKFQNPRFKN